MSLKVAIASSDGINIDLHFGKASSFYIYELQGKNFVQTEVRDVPVVNSESSGSSAESAGGGECGSGGFGGSDCGGFGGGCGSGFGAGCGGSGGGCGGGAGGAILPRVSKLLDCRAIVAAQIGQNMRRQFERNAVSVFDIELPVEEALNKLAAYYTKFGD